MPFSQLPTARSQSAPRRAPTTGARARLCLQPKRGLHAGAHRARRRLRCARSDFLAVWRAWGATLSLLAPDETLGDAAELSAAILKIHEDRAYPGAVVARPLVPWGNSNGFARRLPSRMPRDATLTALALLAAKPAPRCPSTYSRI